jgi:hypothetical protein
MMARIRLLVARIAFTKLQKAIFGTRRVALESNNFKSQDCLLVRVARAQALAAFVWLGVLGCTSKC